jgi:DnaJ like chaperone protein
MSIWARLGDVLSRASGRALSGALESLRALFRGDPQLRRRVAFSIAMIALSAKMAKADGVVTQDEFRAFQEIFAVPEKEARNVARVYDLAKQDIAGYEAYAERMAALCGSGRRNCALLEDILDDIDAAHFQAILARHARTGEADPYAVLGVRHGAPLEEVRRRYHKLAAESHPDKVIARGVPEEFVAIANRRLAALNAAFETLERGLRRA